jgi:diguanylate cyclase (GGDEF)-like protein
MSSQAHIPDREFTVDALTGLSCRKPFLELAADELENNRRRQAPQLCLAARRGSDAVARIGGDQFAVLLPETDLRQAETIAERLRRMVEETPLPADGRELTATVSVGIAQSRPGGSIEALMQEADDALYEAKRTGRNRVACAAEAPSA